MKDIFHQLLCNQLTIPDSANSSFFNVLRESLGFPYIKKKRKGNLLYSASEIDQPFPSG